MSNEIRPIRIETAKNGYLATQINPYGSDSRPEFFPTFGDLVVWIAESLGEKEFAATISQSAGFAKAFSDYCTALVAPKFAAIEARVNPGIENIVDSTDYGL